MYARQTAPTNVLPTHETQARARAQPSNAARCEDLGLVGALPAAAGCLLDALGALGAGASVVLDAMPESSAVPMALSQRALPWAREWLASLTSERLRLAGADALSSMIDAVAAEGMGVEQLTECGIAAEHLTLGSGSLLSLVRAADGLSLDVSGRCAVGVVAGLGASVSGVDGITVSGVGVSGELGRQAAVTLGWELDRAETLDLVLKSAGTAAALVAGQPILHTLTRVASDWTATRPPDRVRVELEDRAAAAAGTAVPFAAGTDLGAETTIGSAAGLEDGRVYVEVSCAAELAAAVHTSGVAWLLAVFGGALPPLEWSPADGLQVRVSALLRDGVPTAPVFEVTRTRKSARDTASETVTCTDPRALASTLAELADAAQGRPGASVPRPDRAAAGSAAPDLALRRGRTVRIDDPETLRAHPEWSWGPRHGVWSLSEVVIAEHALQVSAEVRVDAAAVEDACGSLARVRRAADPAEELLDLERVIAAAALGESYCADPYVDVEAAAAGIEVTADAEARLRLSAGLGADVDAVALQAGLSGNSRSSLLKRTRVDGSSEAFRALLA
jgi:hypothetical protein